MIRRHISNASWNTIAFIVQMALLVAATPVFIHGIGMDGYGIWMLVSTLVGFNGLASLGLTDATVKFLSQYRAEGNLKGICETIGNTFAIYLLLGVSFSVLIAFFSPLIMGRAFNVGSVPVQTAIQALQIGAIAFTLRLLDSFFSSIIQAYEHYDWLSQIDVVISVALVLSQMGLVQREYGLNALLVAGVVANLVSAIIKLLLVKQFLKLPGVFTPRFSGGKFLEVLDFGFFTWLQSLNSLLFGQADRLLIAAMMDAKILGYYSVCLRIASLVQAIPARTSSFIFPLASYQNALGDIGKLRTTYFTCQNLTIALSISLGIPVFVFSEALLSLWISPEFARDSSLLLRILIVTYAFLSTTILPFYYLNGAGFPRLNAAFGWAGSALTLGSMVVLVPPLGAIGAAVSKLVAHTLSFICYPILHRRVFSDCRWYVGILVVLPIVIAFSAATILCIILPQPPTLFLFILESGVLGLFSIVASIPITFFVNPAPGIPLARLLRSLVNSTFITRKLFT